MNLYGLQRITFVGIFIAIDKYKEQNINLNLC